MPLIHDDVGDDDRVVQASYTAQEYPFFDERYPPDFANRFDELLIDIKLWGSTDYTLPDELVDRHLPTPTEMLRRDSKAIGFTEEQSQRLVCSLDDCVSAGSQAQAPQDGIGQDAAEPTDQRDRHTDTCHAILEYEGTDIPLEYSANRYTWAEAYGAAGRIGWSLAAKRDLSIWDGISLITWARTRRTSERSRNPQFVPSAGHRTPSSALWERAALPGPLY